MKTVRDLMTKKVVLVYPDTSLIEAADLILKHNFSGLPVADKNGILVGILTEYDLIIKGSLIHLPTFIKLLSDFDLYKKDQSLIRDDLKQILSMTVGDVMNSEPLVLEDGASLETTVRAFSDHHRVNPIPVVDANRKVVGVISRADLTKLFEFPDLHVTDKQNEREVDKNINRFLNSFEKQFIFVSKSRTYLWLIASILFMIVGFIIAWALILRITF